MTSEQKVKAVYRQATYRVVVRKNPLTGQNKNYYFIIPSWLHQIDKAIGEGHTRSAAWDNAAANLKNEGDENDK